MNAQEVGEATIAFSKATQTRINSLGLESKLVVTDVLERSSPLPLEITEKLVPWQETPLAPEIERIFKQTQHWIENLLGKKINVSMDAIYFTDDKTFRKIHPNPSPTTSACIFTVSGDIFIRQGVSKLQLLHNINHEIHHRFQKKVVQIKQEGEHGQLAVESAWALQAGLHTGRYGGLLEGLTELGNWYSLEDDEELSSNWDSIISGYPFALIFLDHFFLDLAEKSNISYLEARNKLLIANYTADSDVFRFLRKYYTIDQLRALVQMDPRMNLEEMVELLDKMGIRFRGIKQNGPPESFHAQDVLNLDKIHEGELH